MEFNNELQAKQYLKDTDFYFTIDKILQLTPDQKTKLETNREIARVFIRNIK